MGMMTAGPETETTEWDEIMGTARRSVRPAGRMAGQQQDGGVDKFDKYLKYVNL
jgi:hypothetical protein